jgi:hypothetical protein
VKRVVWALGRRGPARAPREVGAARRGSGRTGSARLGSGGNGAGVAAGGVVAIRAKPCLTHFMKDLSQHACAVGILSLHLQEVLDRFEVRLWQVERVMTSALFSEVRRHDCHTVVKWRLF